jgi:hypothetical protein
MHSKTFRPLLFSLFALAAGAASLSLAACGGDDDGPVSPDAAPGTPDGATATPDAATGVPLSDFSAQLDHAYCDLDVRCRFAVSVDACLQGQTEYNPIPQLVAVVAAGRADYHADLAQPCLDAIAASDCSLTTLTTMSEACSAVFTAKVALGGTCFADEECLSELCTRGCNAGTCCAGSCDANPYGPPGATCNTTDDCDYQGYCPASSTGVATCVARLEEGAACEAGSDTCQFGLTCDGTCKRLPAHGESCMAGVFLPCSDVNDLCDPATAKCVARPLPGEACNADQGVDCVNYARCVIDTCVALALEGEDCAHNECYRGLTCGPDTKCVKRPADPICE